MELEEKVPDFVYPVPRLENDIKALESLFLGEFPSVRHVRSKLVSFVKYGFGDAANAQKISKAMRIHRVVGPGAL